MKKLVYILNEITQVGQDIAIASSQARADIDAGNSSDAKDMIVEMVRLVRQLTIMSNVVRDVLDAMDAEQINSGDLEAAKQVYQEA